MLRITKLEPYFKPCSEKECPSTDQPNFNVVVGDGTNFVPIGITVMNFNLRVGTSWWGLPYLNVFVRVHLHINGHDIIYSGFSNELVNADTVNKINLATGYYQPPGMLIGHISLFAMTPVNDLKVKIKVKLIKRSKWYSHFIYYDQQ